MDRAMILRVLVPVGVLAILMLATAIVVALAGGVNNGGFSRTTEQPPPPPSPDDAVATARPVPEAGDIALRPSARTSDGLDFALDGPDWKDVNNNFPGLKYWDSKPGTGDVLPPGVQLKVHYIGWRTDGLMFDRSRGEPAALSLGGVIAGWSQGLPGLRIGGTRRLYIPSQYGYGNKGAGKNIPPNSDLVFEVELASFTPFR